MIQEILTPIYEFGIVWICVSMIVWFFIDLKSDMKETNKLKRKYYRNEIEKQRNDETNRT